MLTSNDILFERLHQMKERFEVGVCLAWCGLALFFFQQLIFSDIYSFEKIVLSQLFAHKANDGRRKIPVNSRERIVIHFAACSHFSADMGIGSSWHLT